MTFDINHLSSKPPSKSDPSSVFEALHKAAYELDFITMNLILDSGFVIDYSQLHGNRNVIGLVAYLMDVFYDKTRAQYDDNGYKVFSTDDIGELMEIIPKFVRSGFDVNTPFLYLNSLVMAARYNNISLIKCLLNNGLDINKPFTNDSKSSFMMYLFKENNLHNNSDYSDLVVDLIENRQLYNIDLSDLAIDQSRSLTELKYSPVGLAVTKGYVNVFKTIYKNPKVFNLGNFKDIPQLHEVAVKSFEDFVKMFGVPEIISAMEQIILTDELSKVNNRSCDSHTTSARAVLNKL